MYCTVCGMVHMKDPLLLKGGVAHKVVVAIPLKTIFPTSYNRNLVLKEKGVRKNKTPMKRLEDAFCPRRSCSVKVVNWVQRLRSRMTCSLRYPVPVFCQYHQFAWT